MFTSAATGWKCWNMTDTCLASYIHSTSSIYIGRKQSLLPLLPPPYPPASIYIVYIYIFTVFRFFCIFSDLTRRGGTETVTLTVWHLYPRDKDGHELRIKFHYSQSSPDKEPENSLIFIRLSSKYGNHISNTKPQLEFRLRKPAKAR